MNYDSFDCKCANYSEEYVDNHHKHIITGDLTIVNNMQLRRVMEKGLNYHEPKPPNKITTLNAMKSGIDKYIHYLSQKFSLSETMFSSWKSEFLRLARIDLNRCQSYPFNNVLSQKEPKEALKKLQEDFVLVPVDKAANNVVLVCKRYYMQIMTAEIENSSTFNVSHENSVSVMDNIFKSGYGSKCNNKLPALYCTVKMHKAQISFRFITAGCRTILQDTSLSLIHI